MSNFNLKAKNRKTGEIVEFTCIDHGYSNVYNSYPMKEQDNESYDSQYFNELYEVIPQTDLGVNTDTTKKEDILDDWYKQALKDSGIEEVDPNHPYGGMEVCEITDSCKPIEFTSWIDRFNMEFVDEDTGLLNISKYDHERIINFFNQEIK